MSKRADPHSHANLDPAEEPAAKPFPTGRATYELVVLGTQVVGSRFGNTLKVLAQHNDGWKVHFTCPSALDPVKGVRFTVTVELRPSASTNSAFAIGMRPRIVAVQAAHP